VLYCVTFAADLIGFDAIIFFLFRVRKPFFRVARFVPAAKRLSLERKQKTKKPAKTASTRVVYRLWISHCVPSLRTVFRTQRLIVIGLETTTKPNKISGYQHRPRARYYIHTSCSSSSSAIRARDDCIERHAMCEQSASSRPRVLRRQTFPQTLQLIRSFVGSSVRGSLHARVVMTMCANRP